MYKSQPSNTLSTLTSPCRNCSPPPSVSLCHELSVQIARSLSHLLHACRILNRKLHYQICRNTVSRCGVFCSLLSCIEHCKTESMVDVFQIVKALRIQKPGSVQTVVRAIDSVCIQCLLRLHSKEGEGKVPWLSQRSKAF